MNGIQAATALMATTTASSRETYDVKSGSVARAGAPRAAQPVAIVTMTNAIRRTAAASSR